MDTNPTIHNSHSCFIAVLRALLLDASPQFDLDSLREQSDRDYAQWVDSVALFEAGIVSEPWLKLLEEFSAGRLCAGFLQSEIPEQSKAFGMFLLLVARAGGRSALAPLQEGLEGLHEAQPKTILGCR